MLLELLMPLLIYLLLLTLQVASPPQNGKTNGAAPDELVRPVLLLFLIDFIFFDIFFTVYNFFHLNNIDFL